VTSRRGFLHAALAGGASTIGVARGFADTQGDRRMPRVIVCDVNETLLDVGALEPHFKQTFRDGRVLQEWFANVLLYSEVATLPARPAHPDVRDGLQMVRDAGLRLVTLTNSAPAGVPFLWTPCVASSQPPRRTSRSQTRLDFLPIAYLSWQRMRGISLARSVRDAPQPSLPDRATHGSARRWPAAEPVFRLIDA
jgi:hypothetical protein